MSDYDVTDWGDSSSDEEDEFVRLRMDLRRLRLLMEEQHLVFLKHLKGIRQRERAAILTHYPSLGTTLLMWPHEMIMDLLNELRVDTVKKLESFGYVLCPSKDSMYFALFPGSVYKDIQIDRSLDVQTLHPHVATHVYVTYVLPRKQKAKDRASSRKKATSSRPKLLSSRKR
jgi:hypothetical protein